MTSTTEESAKPDKINVPMQVKNYYVLVRPVKLPEKTEGGIVIPDDYRSQQQASATIACVMAIGDLAFKSKTRSGLDLADCSVKIEVGDFVVIPFHAGTVMPIYGTDDEGKEHLEIFKIVKDDSIIGKTDNPMAFLDI